MVNLEYSFTTTLPIEKTFSFIADHFFDNLHVWNNALQKVEKLTPGEVTTGTKGFELQLIQGKPYERKFEVVTYEKNKRFAVKSIVSSQ